MSRWVNDSIPNVIIELAVAIVLAITATSLVRLKSFIFILVYGSCFDIVCISIVGGEKFERLWVIMTGSHYTGSVILFIIEGFLEDCNEFGNSVLSCCNLLLYPI